MTAMDIDEDDNDDNSQVMIQTKMQNNSIKTLKKLATLLQQCLKPCIMQILLLPQTLLLTLPLDCLTTLLP
jgi:hypothetical protein